MILFAILMAATTVIVIIGKPHSHGAAYVNRAMLMIMFWAIIYHVAVYLGMAPITEWIN